MKKKRRPVKQPRPAQVLAQSITTELFTGAFDKVADRLVLECANKDMGGWCREAVERVIEKHLKKFWE